MYSDKAGSYGSSKSGPDKPDNNSSQNSNHNENMGDAHIIVPSHIEANEPFKVTVQFNHYEANHQLNHLKIGIYKDNGKQVGRFSSDGKQFNSPGYSEEQSVTTDNNGQASLTLTAKVSEDVHGAHIRLKQGKRNITTEEIHS